MTKYLSLIIIYYEFVKWDKSYSYPSSVMLMERVRNIIKENIL